MRPSHPIRSRDGRGKTPNHQDITTRDAKTWGAPAESKAKDRGWAIASGSFLVTVTARGCVSPGASSPSKSPARYTHRIESVMSPLILALSWMSTSRFMSSRTAGAPWRPLSLGATCCLSCPSALVTWCCSGAISCEFWRASCALAGSGSLSLLWRGGKSVSVSSVSFGRPFVVCRGPCDPCECSSRWESILSAC